MIKLQLTNHCVWQTEKSTGNICLEKITTQPMVGLLITYDRPRPVYFR